MILSARLRHRITIQRAIYEIGGDGKTTRRWDTIITDMPVMITTRPTSDNSQGDIRERQTRHEITTRWRDMISSKMRAVWGTRKLYFEHVSDPTHRRRELKIIANEPSFEAIGYSRGNVTSPLDAVRVVTQYVEAGTHGNETITGRSVDWLIDTADFILGNDQVTPYISDRISAGDADFLAQPVNGELWHYADPDHTFIKLHTIQVARAGVAA